MYRLLALVVAVLLVTPHASLAKKFTRCGLAKELKKHGIKDLRNWVCLAESESGLNSNVVGSVNRDGSLDNGIFQINNRYWCKNGRKGGDCNIKCEDLKNDNIADDIGCAKKIYKRHGFNAWYGWRSKCQSGLPDLSKCRI
ncbi:lysozyme-like [Zootermopsis nevadensis]|uniref:lysozyme n=1 Tax=Zootermopsis nevadensis TaxID=136037 RepID=A0A067R3S2_ZOONE|nr:lysozyme-like [Zootermopsis nevadensis]KDR16709.1 Lysozyme [Zootermopsis nevadensis]